METKHIERHLGDHGDCILYHVETRRPFQFFVINIYTGRIVSQGKTYRNAIKNFTKRLDEREV